jgi:hypothetical protein
MPRIRSEGPALDAMYGAQVADLGREVSQTDTGAAWPAEESRPDRGSHRSDIVVSPTGARDIDVPAPEEIHRDDRRLGAVGGHPFGPDEGSRARIPIGGPAAGRSAMTDRSYSGRPMQVRGLR